MSDNPVLVRPWQQRSRTFPLLARRGLRGGRTQARHIKAASLAPDPATLSANPPPPTPPSKEGKAAPQRSSRCLSSYDNPPFVEPPRRWLWLAVAVHFLLGGVYLGILPLWGAVPDEPLHYSCIKYDAELLRQPTITDPRPWGEPLAVYCFTADPCGTGGHGPLYYWLSVPLFRLTRGLTVLQQLYVLRLWTLLLSSLMIPLAWAMLRRLFGAEPELVVAGTFLVALVPHRLMLSAVVYNDIACATGTFAYLWLLQRAAGDEGDRRGWFLAGCALGLAFLGKRVALVTVPGTLVAWYLQRRRLDWTAGRAWLALGAWALGFALVGGWWIARERGWSL